MAYVDNAVNLFKTAEDGKVFSPDRFNQDQKAMEDAINLALAALDSIKDVILGQIPLASIDMTKLTTDLQNTIKNAGKFTDATGTKFYALKCDGTDVWIEEVAP